MAAAVKILATTTNFQQSGTGSNEDTGVILNDGEYVTLTSAVAELSVVFKVGSGTTTFGNITKNTLYLSSNAESSASDLDPSHQANFIVGARQQGLTDRVKDIGNQVEELKKPQPVFGGLYEDNATSVITITTGDTYYGWVSALEGITVGVGVDLSNATADQLKIMESGYYYVSFSMSGSGSKAEVIHAAAFKNGVKLVNCAAQSNIADNGSSETLASDGFVYCFAGDYIDLRVTTTTSAETITVNHASLTVRKVN